MAEDDLEKMLNLVSSGSAVATPDRRRLIEQWWQQLRKDLFGILTVLEAEAELDPEGNTDIGLTVRADVRELDGRLDRYIGPPPPSPLNVNHQGPGEIALAQALVSARSGEWDLQDIAFGHAFNEALAGKTLEEGRDLFAGTAATLTHLVRVLAAAVAMQSQHDELDVSEADLGAEELRILDAVYRSLGWLPAGDDEGA